MLGAEEEGTSHEKGTPTFSFNDDSSAKCHVSIPEQLVKFGGYPCSNKHCSSNLWISIYDKAWHLLWVTVIPSEHHLRTYLLDFGY